MALTIRRWWNEILRTPSNRHGIQSTVCHRSEGRVPWSRGSLSRDWRFRLTVMAPWKSPIYTCYAMPMSDPQLGVRLLAYAETKGSITTFRLVAKYSDMIALRTLPEAVLSMIADSYSRFCLLGGLVRLYHGYDDILGQEMSSCDLCRCRRLHRV